jgi:hypothetical protein
MERTRLAPQLPASLARLAPDAWTEPFWRAAREHRLVAPRCRACGAFRMPPGPYCWRCRTQPVDWVELSGRGTVYTCSVTRQALVPFLREAVPYVVAVVELEGAPGVRLVGNVLDVDPAEVRIGMPVRVAWDDIDEATTIPRFVPEDA